MRERFTGKRGKAVLLEALREQRVVQCEAGVAESLANAGQVVRFPNGHVITGQGAADDSAYFLLAGQAGVFVNDREVARRGARELIGEMAIVDPAATRSATVVARGEVVALRVRREQLERVAAEHPSVWRGIAKVLVERLREREKYHLPKNARPVVFVGSASEGLSIVEQVVEQCRDDPFEVRPWKKSVFGLGGVAVDDLLAQVRTVDFALFVMTPDDMVCSRGDDGAAPRDNVIFELGLFMERLDRTRSIMLMERGSRIKIPTDLLGITALTYGKRGSLEKRLASACMELRAHVEKLGPL